MVDCNGSSSILLNVDSEAKLTQLANAGEAGDAVQDQAQVVGPQVGARDQLTTPSRRDPSCTVSTTTAAHASANNEESFPSSSILSTPNATEGVNLHATNTTSDVPLPSGINPARALDQPAILTSNSSIAFKCHDSRCNKVFFSRQALTRHTRIHTGDKPYACMHCCSAFYCASHLTRHVRQHTNTRPYTCPTCGKAYIDHTNLIRHAVLHHDARPYACGAKGCDATFIMERALREHIIDTHRLSPLRAKGQAKRTFEEDSVPVEVMLHTGGASLPETHPDLAVVPSRNPTVVAQDHYEHQHAPLTQPAPKRRQSSSGSSALSMEDGEASPSAGGHDCPQQQPQRSHHPEWVVSHDVSPIKHQRLAPVTGMVRLEPTPAKAVPATPLWQARPHNPQFRAASQANFLPFSAQFPIPQHPSMIPYAASHPAGSSLPPSVTLGPMDLARAQMDASQMRFAEARDYHDALVGGYSYQHRPMLINGARYPYLQQKDRQYEQWTAHPSVAAARSNSYYSNMHAAQPSFAHAASHSSPSPFYYVYQPQAMMPPQQFFAGNQWPQPCGGPIQSQSPSGSPFCMQATQAAQPSGLCGPPGVSATPGFVMSMSQQRE